MKAINPKSIPIFTRVFLITIFLKIMLRIKERIVGINPNMYKFERIFKIKGNGLNKIADTKNIFEIFKDISIP